MTTVSTGARTPAAIYATSVYPSITEVDWDEWNALRDSRSDPLMDPRFILAVENSMREDANFRHVVVRDDRDRPMATACLCSYRINGALLAEGASRKIAAVINRVAPRLLQFRVILCGLPVSVGASHLRFSPDADHKLVLEALERVAVEFAREDCAKCIVFKEFTAQERVALAALESLGYRRAESPPMNCVPAAYGSFEDYVAQTNSGRRRMIRRAQAKFATHGLKVVHLRGGEGVAELFTDEVYALYDAVLERATIRFERLPAEFFREVARQLPDESLFTLVFDGRRIVAFAISLTSADVFEQLFVGINYERNSECDLYFNLFFHALDAAFSRNPERIFVGQTSDEFKHQKLAARQFPLSIYAKPADRLTRLVMAATFSSFFPARPLKYPE